ncbi:HTH-type transcriptional regulator RafR [Defluviimonas aquaemixtae]|uniref:HTH-type transcriptional regulator RafR n=1 Tax=Albidovulum aquaemixtae TaxID=1542388 RepID=A0A2R8B815_9RHOB|nr:LacI family transcriptional regulator [Defluviimonas aquaemixtae]SPH18770.1 HTH-type transcriptional regulator RafR [Defluviimonas aquaemixtae]
MPERSKAQRPTQRTIAEQAGISVGAVSRALADDPLIAEGTRALVRKIAEEIGYTPDRAAQRLRTGRTHVISLILPPHDEIFGFGTSMIRGISTALDGTPYHLVAMPDFGRGESEATIRRVVRDSLADGIIFSRTEPDDPRIRFLLEEDFPFVSHGRSELATPHPYVDYDNFEFARRAAKRLVAIGAQHLAILLPPRRFMFSHHLLHGFMTTVRENGVRHEILDNATLVSPPDTIKDAIARRYAEPDPPDALVLPGDMAGLAALAAIQDLGLVPGREVHLIVKQASGMFGLVRPRVESLYEDLGAAGEKLAALLLRRINGEPAAALQFVQPVAETPVS